MTIQTESRGDMVIITAPVEMDVDISPLKELLESFLESNRTHIVLNMESTTFINSISIGVLVNYIHLFRKKRGDILLLNPNAGIKKIMTLAGILKSIKVIGKIEDADKFFQV